MRSPTSRIGRLLDPLPRRDILAICAYLNRRREGPKPVDLARQQLALERDW